MGDKDDNSDDNKYSKLENEDDDAWIDIANIPLSKVIIINIKYLFIKLKKKCFFIKK